MKGYEELRASSAWFDSSSRGRIRVTGEDRARLLHAMCTNQIEGMKPGEGCYAFFLTAQGRILADAVILCSDDHFLLDTEPETRQKLFEHLDKFIIADDVTLEDESDATISLTLEGPHTVGFLRGLGAQPPEQEFHFAEWAGRKIVRVHPEQFRILAPAADRADLTSRLGQEADAESAEITRLERGVPRYGAEITERFLVQETRQLHAVHFSKGCYLGQEIVERVRSRGQVHRGLAPVELDSQTPPPAGSEIQDASGAKCGEMLSSVFSPAMSRALGFGMLRVDQLGPQAKPMTIGGVSARVRIQ
jgi:folate-binding protein YgfZ